MAEKKALISKVKIENDQTATIEFKKSTNMNTSQIVFTGKEKVTQEFAEAFQKTISSFIEIMPALRNEAKNMTMNSIKFDYGKDERLEKVSYAVKYTPQKNVLTNIPVNSVPIYREDFSETTFAVSGKDEELLYKLLDFAEKYINGDTRTKQGEFEFEYSEEK